MSARSPQRRATRLGKKREDSPASGSGGDGELEQLQESIVRRTNDLFVKLNITTRPIQQFEELQKSASSMFVAIFETLFVVRLKNVIRKPRVVTDYITNAQLVMTALSESLALDLSYLSGEAIYRGDPLQIHQMLSIFERLWNQLFLSRSQNPPLPGASQAKQQEQRPAQSKEDQAQLRKEQQVQQQPQQNVQGQQSQQQQNLTQQQQDVHKQAQEEKQLQNRVQPPKPKPPATSGRTVLGKKKTSQAPSGSSKGKPSKAPRRAKKEVENMSASLRNELRARKSAEDSLPPTKGSMSLKRAVDAAVRVVSEPGNASQAKAQSRSQADMDSLRVLAHQYPSVYKAVMKRMGLQRQVNPNKENRHSAAAMLERDLERYQSAYKMLVKGVAAENRRKAIQSRNSATRQARAAQLDEQIETLRNRRYATEQANAQRGRRMARAVREEILAKQLFVNALELESRYLREQRELHKEEETVADRQRTEHYMSLQKYYQDREELLAEQDQREQRDRKIIEQARVVAIRQLERKLRGEFEKRLQSMETSAKEAESRNELRTTEDLNKTFENLGEELRSKLRLFR